MKSGFEAFPGALNKVVLSIQLTTPEQPTQNNLFVLLGGSHFRERPFSKSKILFTYLSFILFQTCEEVSSFVSATPRQMVLELQLCI